MRRTKRQAFSGRLIGRSLAPSDCRYDRGGIFGRADRWSMSRFESLISVMRNLIKKERKR